MIPHLYLAGAVAVATFTGGIYVGVKTTNWHRDSQELAITQAAAKAGEAATTAAVEQIKNLRPQFTTINQPLQKELHSETRYVSGDCAHTDAVWGLLDRAYQAAGGQPFSDRASLPTSAPAAGSNSGSNSSGTR